MSGLSSHFIGVANDLRRLRNAVAHGGMNVTIAGALDYIDAAEQLANSGNGADERNLVAVQTNAPESVTRTSGWPGRTYP